MGYEVFEFSLLLFTLDGFSSVELDLQYLEAIRLYNTYAYVVDFSMIHPLIVKPLHDNCV